jgi:hypothetical protein
MHAVTTADKDWRAEREEFRRGISPRADKSEGASKLSFTPLPDV